MKHNTLSWIIRRGMALCAVLSLACSLWNASAFSLAARHRGRSADLLPAFADIRGTLAAKANQATARSLRSTRSKEATRRKKRDEDHHMAIKKAVESAKPMTVAVKVVPMKPPTPPPPQVKIAMQEVKVDGEATGKQTLKLTTGNAGWDSAKMEDLPVRITLLDAQSRAIGEPQTCRVADGKITIDLPKEAFDIPGKQFTRTFKNGRNQAPNEDLGLSVTSKIAAIEVGLAPEIAREYEVSEPATQTYPELAADRIRVDKQEVQVAGDTDPSLPIRSPSLRYAILLQGTGKQKPVKPPVKPPPADSKPEQMKEERIHLVYSVAEAPLETIKLTRQVADFTIKGPEGVNFQFGDQTMAMQKGGKAGEPRSVAEVEYSAGAYRFRLPLSEFKSGQIALTTRRELKGGVQEAIVFLPVNPDAYTENVIDPPALKLVKLTSVKVGNTIVTPQTLEARSDIPLSVFGTFFPSPDSVAFEGLPNLKDKNSRGAGRIIKPRTGNDEGRYGYWHCYDQAGIWVHLREIKEGGGKQQRKIAMDGIRLVSAEGGSVGNLTVGMAREEARNALGAPGPPLDTTLDLYAERFKDVQKQEPRLLEKPDETFLENGVRVKYDGDRIKWIELRRPTPLLLQGTIAFVHPERKRFAIVAGREIGDVDPGAYTVDLVRRAGIARLVDSPDEADYILTPGIRVTYRILEEKDYRTIKVAKHDKNGNVELDKNGKAKTEDKQQYTHTDEILEVTTTLTCGVERVNDNETRTRLPAIQGVAITRTRGPGSSNHDPTDYPIRIRRSDAPELARELARLGGNSGQGALKKQIFDLCNLQGRVMQVDYQKNELTVNLGSQDGVQPKGEDVTEMDLFVRTGDVRDYSFVDPETGHLFHPDPDATEGAPENWTYLQENVVRGERPLTLSGEKVKMLLPLGEKIGDWGEVKGVYADRCVISLKKKGDFGRTSDDWRALQRVPDPSNGLVIVRVRVKKGDTK